MKIKKLEVKGTTFVNVPVFRPNDLEILGLTKSEAEKKYVELVKADRRERAENELMLLVDEKQESAYRLILGYKSTTKQIERYKDKYERALQGEFTNAVNAVIISKFEAMRDAIRQFTDLIEYFRGAVDDLIQAGELGKAEKAIEAGKLFDEKTTQKDVKKLLSVL